MANSNQIPEKIQEAKASGCRFYLIEANKCQALIGWTNQKTLMRGKSIIGINKNQNAEKLVSLLNK